MTLTFNHSSQSDFAAILQASQSLASSVKLEDVLHHFTQIVLQQSGGDYCAVVLPDSQGNWFVRAVATPEATDLCADRLTETVNLPLKLIQYVQTQHEMVVLDQRTTATDWPVVDDYLMQRQPQSAACLPMCNQEQLVGVLYVDHHSTCGLLTCDRIAVLNFLCGQAAISLEQVRLQVQAQERARHLEQSQQRLQLIIQQTPVAVMEWNRQFEIQSWNPAAEKIFGYSSDEMIGQHFRQIIPKEFHAYIDDVAQQILSQVGGSHVINENLTKDQCRITCEWFNAPMRDANGEVCGGISIALDISDRKRIEAERQQVEANLRRNEERYRSLITVTSQIVWISTPDGCSVESPNWCEYTGQSRDKLKNFGWLEAVHPDDSEPTGIIWNHARETKTWYKVEYRIRGANGEYRYFDVQGVPILNDDGSIREWMGSCTDIEDRKQAEKAVLQKSQALEQAMAELQNTQLQMVQSEKMASLGNLVAGVAHEINNPIGFLNGSINNARDYVQDLLDHLALYQHHQPPTQPVEEHAEDIELDFLAEDLPKLLNSMQGATERIKSISTSLRTFSRADTEHKVCTNLHEGLDSTLLILKYRLKANEQRPAIEVVPQYGELPCIACFPGQLNQVFMNILANAIDVFDEMAQQSSFAALQAHPQQIVIQTATLPEQRAVEIRIRDNGQGMTEEVRTRIFDHLFTTKGVGKGTGLGLAIAHQIVTETHGGQLTVNSAPGQGSEFCICLPIAAE